MFWSGSRGFGTVDGAALLLLDDGVLLLLLLTFGTVWNPCQAVVVGALSWVALLVWEMAGLTAVLSVCPLG